MCNEKRDKTRTATDSIWKLLDRVSTETRILGLYLAYAIKSECQGTTKVIKDFFFNLFENRLI